MVLFPLLLTIQMAGATEGPPDFTFSPWPEGRRTVEIVEYTDSTTYGQPAVRTLGGHARGVETTYRHDEYLVVDLSDLQLDPSENAEMPEDERTFMEAVLQTIPETAYDRRGHFERTSTWRAHWNAFASHMESILGQTNDPPVQDDVIAKIIDRVRASRRDLTAYQATLPQRLLRKSSTETECTPLPIPEFPEGYLDRVHDTVDGISTLPPTRWSDGQQCIRERTPCHEGHDAPTCLEIEESVHGTITGFTGYDVVDLTRGAIQAGVVHPEDLRYDAKGEVHIGISWTHLVDPTSLRTWGHTLNRDVTTTLIVRGGDPVLLRRDTLRGRTVLGPMDVRVSLPPSNPELRPSPLE